MTNLDKRLADLKEATDKLIETASKLVEKPENSRKPEVGDYYWTIDSLGNLDYFCWKNNKNDNKRLEAGNVFPSEEAAEMEQLRRKSKAQAWLPEENEGGYVWDFTDKEPVTFFFSHNGLTLHSQIGDAKPTEKECQAWYDEFGKAFEYNIKK